VILKKDLLIQKANLAHICKLSSLLFVSFLHISMFSRILFIAYIASLVATAPQQNPDLVKRDWMDWSPNSWSGNTWNFLPSGRMSNPDTRYEPTLARRGGSSWDRPLVARFNQHGVKGHIVFTPIHDGSHVEVRINKGLDVGFAYHYHIHQNAVTGGDCNTTGAHYDPKKANTGSNYVCDPKRHSTCEAGDLSGKWGGLTRHRPTGWFSKWYDDRRISTRDIVGRSVVIHNKDNSKWVCANLVQE
jgi:hypothetical protein